jgi:Tol biopolymer transport system component
MNPLSRLLTAICVGSVLFGASAPPVRAQSIVDRIKKAAEDAKKKAEEDAKKKDGQPASTTPSGTTPAQPNGKGPATPATPAKKADAAAPPAAGTLPKSSAKVEEQLLVTAQGNNLQFSVSPKGTHAAAVVLRGSRQVVMLDGADGPRFDDIAGGSGGLAFSPDGTRLAYVGRQGQELVVMVNDKELMRMPAATHPHVVTPTAGRQSLPAFTPNSRHVYFYLYTEPTPGVTNGFYQFVYDGVPGPESFSEGMPVFDPGGDHHAYMVESRQNHGTYGLVVDGKVAPYVAGEPQFTADGLHLITKRIVPGTSNTDVLLDGKPIMRAISPRIFTTPVGSGFAAVVYQGNPGSGISFVTIGTQRVQGTDCPWKPGLTDVVFSADAKHWVALCQADTTSQWVLVDGKKGTEYQSIGGIGFTSDGRFVYTASMRGQTFVVTGDQESNGSQALLAVTPDTAGDRSDFFSGVPQMRSAQVNGNRVGYVGSGTAGMNTVVVDGKSLPSQGANGLEFSPDGSRFAFTHGGGNNRTLNVDGTDMPGATMLFKRPALSAQSRSDKEFAFSPDSKHIAYFGRQPNGTYGIFVDGKFTALPGNAFPMNPTFTADSRHLIWMDRPGGPAQVVYVDGRPAVEFESSSLVSIAGTWDMGADGALSVIGQSGDSLKRYRITPAADTSIDMLTK